MYYVLYKYVLNVCVVMMVGEPLSYLNLYPVKKALGFMM